MRKIIFKKITFLDLDEDESEKIINSGGLFVFPSGPGLETINQNNNYHNALKEADYVFFDSGYFVLLLKYLSGSFRSNDPSSCNGIYFKVAPVAFAASCQGTRLL